MTNFTDEKSPRPLVHFEVDDRVAVVTIDHPPMNALDMPTRLALLAVFEELDGLRDQIGAVVLTGAGDKAFVAGADIKAFPDLTPESARRRLTLTHRIFGAVENFERPVVAAIRGYCLGGGLELALACDIRYAARDAKFGFPEVNLSVFPGNGGTARAPHHLSVGRFKEMVFTGEMIGPDEALAYGLIEKVVEVGELRSAAMDLARRIASRGPLGVAAAKRVINRTRNLPLDEGLRLETDHWAGLTTTADMKEGARAFIEKRPPRYTGR